MSESPFVEPFVEPVVELRGAAARVGGRVLWSDVDLALEPGSFTAVLGPNGAGKSTLVRMLLGLHPAAAGEVRVLGRRPGGRGGAAVGYLPQRRHFDAGVRLRGTDLVRLGLDGDRFGLTLRRSRADRERVEHVIDLVGASAYAHRPIGACSGGEQQRLLIAQALVRGPRLLVMDEPLDSLDLPNQAAVAALTDRVRREEGVAVLMVVHDMNPVLPYLDTVVYLAGGRVASGPPDAVVTGPVLSRLYGTPVEVLRTSAGGIVVVAGGQAEAGQVAAVVGGGHVH